MNLECPHCAATLEIDEETRLGLEKLDTFDCPACGESIPSPLKPATAKAGLSVFKSVNRNLLILGSAAILVIGGVVAFLATRDPGDTTEVDRKVNEQIIHNEFFTRLVESGATTYEDLREIDHFAAYGDGYVGMYRTPVGEQDALAFANRLGGALLDIAILPGESRREMGEMLAREIPALAGRCVWIADEGRPCGLDAPDVLPPSEQGRFGVLVAWPAEQAWINLGWKWVIDPDYDEVRPFSEWGFAIVRVGKLWGIIDEQGKTVLETNYEEISDFSEHGCAKVLLDGKWGLVDRNGTLVAKPEWEDVQDLINGFIPVQRNGKWGYLDATGKMVIACQWDNAWRFSPEGYAVVTRHVPTQQEVRYGEFYERKRGIIDRRGKIIVEPTWDGAINFSKEGLGLLRMNGSGWALVDTSGKILHPPTLNLLWRDRRWDLGFLPHTAGLIGKDGQPGEVSDEARYALIKPKEGRFSEGLLRHDSENGSSFVDVTGAEVIKTPGIFCRDFSNGFAAAGKGGKWGFIDKSGKLVIDAVWDEVRDFTPIGKAAVRQEQLWGWVNKDGTVSSEPLWDEVRPFVNGYSAVKRGQNWGFVDLKGKVIAKPQWKEVTDFSEGFASVLVAPSAEMSASALAQFQAINPTHPARNFKFWSFIDHAGRLAFDGRAWYQPDIPGNKPIQFSEGFVSGNHVGAKPSGDDSEIGGIMDKNGRFHRLDWLGHWHRRLKGGLVINEERRREGGLPYFDRHGKNGPPVDLRDAEGNLVLAEIAPMNTDPFADRVPYAMPPKYGLLDAAGNVVVPPTWDYAYIQSPDRVIIEMNGKKGLVDGRGQVLIEPEWDELQILTVVSSTLDEDGKTLLFGKGVVLGGIGTRFLSPWVRVMRDDRSFILRDNGTPAIPETMAEATYVDFYGPDHVMIKETDAEGNELRSLYHPATGEKISFPGADKLHYNWNTAHYGFIWERVEVGAEKVWRLRNLRGQDPGHTQPETEEPVGWGFMHERARLHDGIGWYFVDPQGRAISAERWEDLRDFREGFAAVKRDGMWGFIRPDGTALTEILYEEVLDFHEGLAGVKIDGLWGFIDSSGAMVIAPVWDEAQNFARWSGEKENGIGDAATLAVTEVKIRGAAALIGKDGNLIIDPRSPKLQRKGAAFVNGREQLILVRENGNDVIKTRAWENNMDPWNQLEASPTRLWQQVHRALAEGGSTWKLFDEDRQEISQGDWARPYHVAKVDPFSEGLITGFSREEKFGLLRWDGSVAVEPDYDRIAWVAPGVAAVWNKTEGGLYRADGTWLFKDNDKTRIARFTTRQKENRQRYRHGLVVIEDTPRWGYIRLNRPSSK